MSSEYTEPTPTFAIITCSDTRTLETDTAGAVLKKLIAERGWVCLEHVVVEDERPFISGALLACHRRFACRLRSDLRRKRPFPRDVTPEATIDVCKRNVPASPRPCAPIACASPPRAMLSRGVCMEREGSVVINFPGSEKAARENWEAIADVLPHAALMKQGGGH